MLHATIGEIHRDLLDEFFWDDAPAGDRVYLGTRVADLPTLLVVCKIFSSKGQARKAGFVGPVPAGIHLLGTNKHRFWCWCHPAATSDTATTCDNRCRCPKKGDTMVKSTEERTDGHQA